MEQKKSKLIFYDSMRSSNNGDQLALKPSILKKINKKFHVKPTVLKASRKNQLKSKKVLESQQPTRKHARKQKFVEKSDSQLELVHDEQAIEEEVTLVIDVPSEENSEDATCINSDLILQDAVEEMQYTPNQLKEVINSELVFINESLETDEVAVKCHSENVTVLPWKGDVVEEMEEIISTPEIAFIKQELEENEAAVECSPESIVTVLSSKDEVQYAQTEEIISTPEIAFIKQELEENEAAVECPSESNTEFMMFSPESDEEESESHIPCNIVQTLESNLSCEDTEEFVSNNSMEHSENIVINGPYENTEDYHALNSTTEMEGEFVIESLGPDEVSDSYYDGTNGPDQDAGSDSEQDRPMDFPQHFMAACNKAPPFMTDKSADSCDLRQDISKEKEAFRKSNYRCMICKKRYKYRRTLVEHFRLVHPGLSVRNDNKIPTSSLPGIMNYVCSSCNAPFNCPKILSKHEEIVHRIRPKQALQCSTCSREFILAENLYRHSKLCGKLKELSERQHMENILSSVRCPFCTRIAKSTEALDLHIQMVHLLYSSSQQQILDIAPTPPDPSETLLILNKGMTVMDGNILNLEQDGDSTNLVQILSENSLLSMPNFSESSDLMEQETETNSIVVQSMDGAAWVVAPNVGDNEGEPGDSWSQITDTPVSAKVAIPRQKPRHVVKSKATKHKSKAGKHKSKPKEKSSAKNVARDRGWLRKLQTPNYQENQSDSSSSEPDSS